jgi:hypothetical protein
VTRESLGPIGPNDTRCLILSSAYVFVLFLSFGRAFFIIVLWADEYRHKKKKQKIELK